MIMCKAFLILIKTLWFDNLSNQFVRQKFDQSNTIYLQSKRSVRNVTIIFCFFLTMHAKKDF